MTVTSRWPAVIDAALATLAPITTTYDGPEVDLSSEQVGEFVVVGGDGNRKYEGDAGNFDQQWAGLGPKNRDETGEILLGIVVQTGDAAIKPSRDRAFAIIGLIEAALVADPTLGGAVASGWLLPMSGAPEQRENSYGSYVRVVVTLKYKARI